MKVTYLGRYSTGEILTGPEKVAARIFAESVKDHDSEFLTYFFDGRSYGIIKKLFGMELIAELDGCKVLRMGIVRMLLHIAFRRPEVIHVITFERFASAIRFIKIFLSARFVFTVHGIAVYEDEHFKNADAGYVKTDRKAETALFRISDRIAFLSEQIKAIASEYYRIDESKSVLVPNGIDEVFSVISKQHTDSVTLKIVFPANIAREEKGFEILRRALMNCSFDYKLFIVGHKTDITGVEHEFVDPMNTEMFSRFLSDKDVLVSSSIYEPFSLAAVEAMAAGVAAVVSDATGMSRYLKDGVNGFIFTSGNSGQLSEILAKLYHDRVLLRRISEEARNVYPALSWSNVFCEYKKLYG